MLHGSTISIHIYLPALYDTLAVRDEVISLYDFVDEARLRNIIVHVSTEMCYTTENTSILTVKQRTLFPTERF